MALLNRKGKVTLKHEGYKEKDPRRRGFKIMACSARLAHKGKRKILVRTWLSREKGAARRAIYKEEIALGLRRTRKSDELGRNFIFL